MYGKTKITIQTGEPCAHDSTLESGERDPLDVVRELLRLHEQAKKERDEVFLETTADPVSKIQLGIKQDNACRFVSQSQAALGCGDLKAALPKIVAEVDRLRAQLRWHESLVGVERVLFACALGEATKEDGDRARERGKMLKRYGKLVSAARYEAIMRHDEHGGSQERVAKRADVALVDLSLAERGVLPPFDDDTTRRICAAIGCDPQPLLDAAAKIEEVLRG